MSTDQEWVEQIARELEEMYGTPVEHFWTYTRGADEGDQDWRLDVWGFPSPIKPGIHDFWMGDWRPSWGDPRPTVDEEILPCDAADVLDVLIDAHEDPDEAWQIWHWCVAAQLDHKFVQILKEASDIRYRPHAATRTRNRNFIEDLGVNQ